MARLLSMDHVEGPATPAGHLREQSCLALGTMYHVASATLALSIIVTVGLVLVLFRDPRLRPTTLRILGVGGLLAMGAFVLRLILT